MKAQNISEVFTNTVRLTACRAADIVKGIEKARFNFLFPGVAVRLNASPHRFDIDWRMLPKAKTLGAGISINPDVHRVEGPHVVPFDVGVARKGWLTKEDVINTQAFEKIMHWLQRR